MKLGSNKKWMLKEAWYMHLLDLIFSTIFWTCYAVSRPFVKKKVAVKRKYRNITRDIPNWRNYDEPIIFQKPKPEIIIDAECEELTPDEIDERKVKCLEKSKR